MKILIDTHIAMWAVLDDPKLSHEARELLTDEKNEVFYSTVSIWETVIKHTLHPNLVAVDGDELMKFCEYTGFKELTITSQHAITVKSLQKRNDAPKHNDPFDRMLIAQAKAEGIKLMTHDSFTAIYDEECILAV